MIYPDIFWDIWISGCSIKKLSHVLYFKMVITLRLSECKRLLPCDLVYHIKCLLGTLSFNCQLSKDFHVTHMIFTQCQFYFYMQTKNCFVLFAFYRQGNLFVLYYLFVDICQHNDFVIHDMLLCVRKYFSSWIIARLTLRIL